ncbi:MAG: hypothetical protein HY907_12610 [Deltaproteobacteria bacterium]|nr:hypothetical protein [Deltaproteobacteria bacterium]
MTRLPAGVERVLDKAAEDSAFRDALTSAEAASRADVARAASIKLTPSEATVLAAAPVEDLRRMIDEVAKTQERRRALVRLALGTAAVGTVAAGTVGVCTFLFRPGYIVSAGVRHDLPPGRLAGCLLSDDLTGPRSAQEILDVLRSAAPELASADWVLGTGTGSAPNYAEYRVTVGTDGAVHDLEHVRDQHLDRDVRNFLCFVLQARSSYRPADGETQFTVRFVFEPR